jgi:hypothetical protein
MSESQLTPDEIAKLLTAVDGDDTGSKRQKVSQGEISRLLTAIDANYSRSPNNTEPLSQDEINQLLAAIAHGKT